MDDHPPRRLRLVPPTDGAGDSVPLPRRPSSSPPPEPNRDAPGEPVDRLVERFWIVVESNREALLLHSLRLMRGHRADAEDAVSTAVTKARRAFERDGSSIANVDAWLHHVLRNVCMDVYRERDRWDRRVDELGAMRQRAQDAAGAVDPERRVLQAELAEEVAALVAELPDSLRLPIVMRFGRELPYPDIARRLGITDANARKRVQLAREQLRRRLLSRE